MTKFIIPNDGTTSTSTSDDSLPSPTPASVPALRQTQSAPRFYPQWDLTSHYLARYHANEVKGSEVREVAVKVQEDEKFTGNKGQGKVTQNLLAVESRCVKDVEVTQDDVKGHKVTEFRSSITCSAAAKEISSDQHSADHIKSQQVTEVKGHLRSNLRKLEVVDAVQMKNTLELSENGLVGVDSVVFESLVDFSQLSLCAVTSDDDMSTQSSYVGDESKAAGYATNKLAVKTDSSKSTTENQKPSTDVDDAEIAPVQKTVENSNSKSVEADSVSKSNIPDETGTADKAKGNKQDEKNVEVTGAVDFNANDKQVCILLTVLPKT
jgi:hypothetical protein